MGCPRKPWSSGFTSPRSPCWITNQHPRCAMRLSRSLVAAVFTFGPVFSPEFGPGSMPPSEPHYSRQRTYRCAGGHQRVHESLSPVALQTAAALVGTQYNTPDAPCDYPELGIGCVQFGPVFSPGFGPGSMPPSEPHFSRQLTYRSAGGHHGVPGSLTPVVLQEAAALVVSPNNTPDAPCVYLGAW
jgi:hypothetical protein